MRTVVLPGSVPAPGEVTDEDDDTRKQILMSMAEWHYEHPEQPHPMSGEPISGLGRDPLAEPPRTSVSLWNFPARAATRRST